jgi:hypothetical protein
MTMMITAIVRDDTMTTLRKVMKIRIWKKREDKPAKERN